MAAETRRNSGKNAIRDISDRVSNTPSIFRALASKPPVNLQFQTSVRYPDRCRTCARKICTLLSHRMYNARCSAGRSRSTGRPPILARDDTFEASYASRLALRFVDRSLATDRVDPFLDLPLPTELYGRVAQMHELFFGCGCRSATTRDLLLMKCRVHWKSSSTL